MVSNIVYIDKLDKIVDKYNKTYRTIKMKLADVQSSMYTDYGVEHNCKDPKSKVGDHVRIAKYKNIFANGYTLNWSEGVFVIKKVKKYCTMDIRYQW